MWTVIMLLSIFKACAFSRSSEFKSFPTTVKAPENDTVLLPCYLQTSSDDSPKSPIKIRWYKDGRLLVDSSIPQRPAPDRFTLWGNGSLQVVKIEPKDTAEYMCEIIRPYPWSTIQQIHAIEVLHPPSVTPDPISGVLRVKIGEQVWMSCKPQGVPYPIMNWYKEGVELKLLDHRELLKFIAIDRSLSGNYTCVARNGVGNPASAKIRLIINYPPELMTHRSTIFTAPGIKVELKCDVSADPPATVQWLKDNIPIDLNYRIMEIDDENQHILVIRNVTSDDFGEYTCRAHNKMGHGEIHIQVTGIPQPPVFKMANQHDVNTKNSYKLIWEVDSYMPIIEYLLSFKSQSNNRWKKLYIPAEMSTGYTHSKMYTFEGLKENTIYEAFVTARNRFGWSKPSNTFMFATDGAGPDVIPDYGPE
ncbi:limbic system-associated membrane protein-like [Agrilus planipennis]|uniref:Limbic system-associated membrane protein-like n=1 Tax=Agrilus planipennis TaxID=224129 RepID=A0A7F5R395_AGRPL|nr:limbic system-associated membrane protein-like [Agrilus planipennis]